MLAAKARGGGPRSGERNRLFFQRSQGVSQRRARYRHQPGERLAQFQNQENRARGRRGKQRKAGEHRDVQRREQAKACKDDYEPKRQNCQKRRRNKIVGFDKQQRAGLREVIAQLRGERWCFGKARRSSVPRKMPPASKQKLCRKGPKRSWLVAVLWAALIGL